MRIKTETMFNEILKRERCFKNEIKGLQKTQMCMIEHIKFYEEKIKELEKTICEMGSNI